MKLSKLFVSVLGAILIFLPQVSVAADAEAGKKLYEQVCSYCHLTTYDDKFGPGLAEIIERVDEVWLDKFLLNPEEMTRTDEYAKSLREGNAYNLTMPALPQMKDPAQRADIIAYLKTLGEVE